MVTLIYRNKPYLLIKYMLTRASNEKITVKSNTRSSPNLYNQQITISNTKFNRITINHTFPSTTKSSHPHSIPFTVRNKHRKSFSYSGTWVANTICTPLFSVSFPLFAISRHPPLVSSTSQPTQHLPSITQCYWVGSPFHSYRLSSAPPLAHKSNCCG